MAPRREKKTISRSVKCNILFEFFMSSVQVHTTNPGKSCNRTFFTKLNNRDVSSLVPLCYLRLPIGFILMFLKWFHNGSIEDHSSERIPITVINWLSRLLSSRAMFSNDWRKTLESLRNPIHDIRGEKVMFWETPHENPFVFHPSDLNFYQNIQI